MSNEREIQELWPRWGLKYTYRGGNGSSGCRLPPKHVIVMQKRMFDHKLNWGGGTRRLAPHVISPSHIVSRDVYEREIEGQKPIQMNVHIGGFENVQGPYHGKELQLLGPVTIVEQA